MSTTGSGTGTPVPVVAGGPQILTEAIYDEYNGYSGSLSASQLSNAFVIAESMMVSEIGSYLVPTSVTGSYPIPIHGKIRLSKGNIISVDGVSMLYDDGCDNCVLSSLDGCAFITDRLIGVIVPRASGCWRVCVHSGWPYLVQVAFTSGLASGYALTDRRLLQALTMAASLVARQMENPNLVVDSAIIAWSSLRYSERTKETMLRNTAFGGGPISNTIARLVSHLKVAPALGLGY